MQQEAAFKAMGTQRDISEAYAQSGGQPPAIVTPGVRTGGMATPARTTGRIIVCPCCHLKSPVGAKYCQNCGYQFYGEE